MKCDVKKVTKFFDGSPAKKMFYGMMIRDFQADKKITFKEVTGLECKQLTAGLKKKWMRLAFRVMENDRHVILGCRFLETLLCKLETDKELQQREMLAVACVRVLGEMEQEKFEYVRVEDGHKSGN